MSLETEFLLGREYKCIIFIWSRFCERMHFDWKIAFMFSAITDKSEFMSAILLFAVLPLLSYVGLNRFI